MKDLSHLYEAQRLTLDRLTELARIDQINHIVDQGFDELHSRLEVFLRYEQR